MEHANLANSDRSMLDTYCKLFELDWRGDSALENREQFLMTSPIYMHPRDRPNLAEHAAITNESATRQIQQACQPFLPGLLLKMR